MKKVLVAIADGIEDLEAIGIIDMLDRSGAKVVTASVDHLQIVASHNTKITADKLIKDCLNEEYDMVICPGGLPGAEHLRDSKDLVKILHKQKKTGKYYAAICASPYVVLYENGLLDGLEATAYPTFAEKFTNKNKISEAVVVDGNCITGQGAGVVMQFSLKLIEILFGLEKANQIKQSMLIR